MFKSHHPLYGVYKAMLGRCYYTAGKQYPNWGGRGITVCDAWRADFWQFVEDMGPRPAGYSLDRIDNDGNYEPQNCRWATHQQQMLNRRDYSRKLVIGGVEKSERQWERETGIPRGTLRNRVQAGKPIHPGPSLQSIADREGVTREAIRQRIKRGWKPD